MLSYRFVHCQSNKSLSPFLRCLFFIPTFFVFLFLLFFFLPSYERDGKKKTFLSIDFFSLSIFFRVAFCLPFFSSILHAILFIRLQGDARDECIIWYRMWIRRKRGTQMEKGNFFLVFSSCWLCTSGWCSSSRKYKQRRTNL